VVGVFGDQDVRDRRLGRRPPSISRAGAGACTTTSSQARQAYFGRCTKRLEEGAIRWPKIENGVMRLSAAQFSALLEGSPELLQLSSPAALPERCVGHTAYVTAV